VQLNPVHAKALFNLARLARDTKVAIDYLTRAQLIGESRSMPENPRSSRGGHQSAVPLGGGIRTSARVPTWI